MDRFWGDSDKLQVLSFMLKSSDGVDVGTYLSSTGSKEVSNVIFYMTTTVTVRLSDRRPSQDVILLSLPMMPPASLDCQIKRQEYKEIT